MLSNLKYSTLTQYLNSTGFWCAAPFSNISLSVDGDYSLCCIAKDYSFTISDMSLEEYVNCTEVNQIRQEMITNTLGVNCLTYCNKCIQHEQLGVTSRRHWTNRQISNLLIDGQYNSILSKIESTLLECIQNPNAILLPANMGFSLIDLKIFGNLCNLKCIMCHPDSSSLIAEDYKQVGLWDNSVHLNPYRDLSYLKKEQFLSQLNVVLSNTSTLRLTGGELLINKDVYGFLEYITQQTYVKNLTLDLTTNGTIVSDKFTKLLNKFKNVTLGISIDAYGDINDLQRRGSSFKIIDKNIDYYKSFDFINTILVSTITPMTISKIDELFLYSLYKLNRELSISICLTPKKFSIIYLPNYLKQHYLSKLEINKYNNNFNKIINTLKHGKEDIVIFRSYLKYVFDLYGKDKILKYFPEYKPYVTY